MTDPSDVERPFLEAIANNPDDDDARAVYADWLEERGDLRGEYVRLEAQLHRIPLRLAEIEPQLHPSWLAAIARRYDVWLGAAGPNKILVIKLVREITGLGLKDSKDLVELASADAPKQVRTALDRNDAVGVVTRFDASGAHVFLAPHRTTVRPPPITWPVRAASGPTYALVLATASRDARVRAIKAVRECTVLGLKEAKELVDHVVAGQRRVVASGLSHARATEHAARFAGVASVVIEPER